MSFESGAKRVFRPVSFFAEIRDYHHSGVWLSTNHKSYYLWHRFLFLLEPTVHFFDQTWKSKTFNTSLSGIKYTLKKLIHCSFICGMISFTIQVDSSTSSTCRNLNLGSASCWRENYISHNIRYRVKTYSHKDCATGYSYIYNICFSRWRKTWESSRFARTKPRPSIYTHVQCWESLGRIYYAALERIIDCSHI